MFLKQKALLLKTLKQTFLTVGERKFIVRKILMQVGMENIKEL